MSLTIDHVSPILAVIRVTGRALRTSVLSEITEACTRAVKDGVRAVVIDFSEVTGIGYSGLASLSELYIAFGERVRLCFCGLNARSRDHLAQIGLDEILPLHDSVAEAMHTPPLRACRLFGTTAVVFADSGVEGILPVSEPRPRALLDMLDRPVLDRVLDRLRTSGVTSSIVCTHIASDEIRAYFRTERPTGIPTFFHYNGRRRPDGSWDPEPLGDATLLARLTRDHAAFNGDVLVTWGDLLTDIDLVEMADYHRDKGADVTIAASRLDADEASRHVLLETDVMGRLTGMPRTVQGSTSMVSAGVYLFRAEVLNRMEEQDSWRIATDLTSALLAEGAHIQTYRAPFKWTPLHSGRDYYRAQVQSLESDMAALVPDAREIRPGVWAAPCATVSPQALIEGPSYIGAGAVIEAEATIRGPAVIGADSVVEGRSLIEDSVICPETYVGEGAIVQGMIAGPDGALVHRYADGGPVNIQPLDALSHVDDPVEEAAAPLDPPQALPKIA